MSIGLLGCKKPELVLSPWGSFPLSESAHSHTMDFEEFWTEKSNGHLYISTGQSAFDTMHFDSNFTYTFSVMGAVVDYTSDSKIPFGNLQIGSSQITMNNDVEYSELVPGDFMGSIVNVVLKDTNDSIEFSEPLYVPSKFKEWEVNVPDPLTVGSTISWNADALNSKGVILSLEYNVGNDVRDFSYRDRASTRLIYVGDDDGSYTLTPQDLEGVNTSGDNLAQLCLIRGNYRMASHSSNPSIKTKIVVTISGPPAWVTTN